MFDQIKQIVDSMGRFREATIERKFNEEQKNFIRTFPGETFKEQMLRAADLGKCRTCGGNTQYVEKVRFAAYCSNACQFQPRRETEREERLIEIHQALKLVNVDLLDPENYINAVSSLKFKCNRCGVNMQTQVARALNHFCKTPKQPKKPKIKIKVIKPKVVVQKKTQRCITCGILRHPKAKPGNCQSCFLKLRHIRVSKEHLETLSALGYSTTATEIWDTHKVYEFTNLECNHTFNTQLQYILNRSTVCSVCGPKKRADRMLNGYMQKYARDYDLRQYMDYAQYVMGLSNYNWEMAGGDSSQRGHTGLHLDHKVPKIYGFKNNIPPEAIADIENLQLLDYQANIRKGGKMTDYKTLAILKEKYDFSAYVPSVVKIREGKNETLLSYIKLKPSKITDTYTIYGDTALCIMHFNHNQSAGNIIRDIGMKYFIVFEDELLDNRRRIVESMLNYSAGISRKIYARKCEVKEILAVDADRFMFSNHLSGRLQSPYRLGLFCDNELVAVMLFGKPRFGLSSKYEWELLRFANKLDTSVVGGVSKLFSHFVRTKNPKSVMSYADKRFGSAGSVYETIGMKLISSTPPQTHWVKDGVRKSAKFLDVPKLLGDSYDSTLGHETNLINNGWVRLEDLGSNVFEYTKDYNL